jgi:predicted dehydrogenase
MITMGVEYGPYTRLAAAFRDAIEQRPPSIAGRAPATFADGVAQMRVLDAVRQSSAGGGRWVDTGGGEG